MTIAHSTTSPVTTGLEYTKKYSKQMLKNSIFVGTFQEKRLVDELDAYRDIITVCPDQEDFIDNIRSVKRKFQTELLTKPWIGLTEPETIGAPVGYNLWVILPREIFGKYWFRVKTVEFLQNEVRLKLDILREYQIESRSIIGEECNESFSVIFQEKKQQVLKNLIYFYRYLLTFDNIKNSVIFIFVLLGMILAGLLSSLQYLLEYLLKLIREFSGLIKVMSPIIISMLNLIGKCTFGLYHLIYALFRGRPKPAPVYNNFINFNPSEFSDPRARYNKYFNDKALPYYPNTRGTGPIITTFDD